MMNRAVRSRRMIMAGLAVGLGLMMAGSLPSVTIAHGELESSRPRANSVLTSAPDQVVIHMTEAADPVFSKIKVFNSDGDRMDLEDTHLVDPETLAVTLLHLDPGTYTVAWQVTSISDSHRTSDVFRFTVSGGGRLFLGTGAGTLERGIDTRPTGANTLGRWTELVGLALVGGGIGTMMLVWRSVLMGAPPGLRARIMRRHRLLVRAGVIAIAVGLVADILVQASTQTHGSESLLSVLGDLLLRTSYGLLFWTRLVPLLVLGTLWYRYVKSDVQPGRLILVASLALLGFVMLGRSLGSHASAADGNILAFSVASDFIHLAAACVWIGGLVALLSAVNVMKSLGSPIIGLAVARFSNVAILSVSIIGLTGLYNAWFEVRTLGALLTTSYGQVLSVKTGFMLLLLFLAAVNLFGFRRKLSRASTANSIETFDRDSRRFGLVVRGEITLALVVFAMTALLAHLPLARESAARADRASEAPMAMPVLVESRSLNIALGVTPNRVGVNTVLLELADAIGNPIPKTAIATVQYSRLDGGVRLAPRDLHPRGEGRFSDRTDALGMVGTWVATVTVTIDGERPLTKDFVFRMAGAAESGRNFVTGILDFLTGREPNLPRTGPLVPDGSGAEFGRGLLRRADDHMNKLLTMFECNNINGVVTELD